MNYKLLIILQTFFQVKVQLRHFLFPVSPSWSRKLLSFNNFRRLADSSETLSGE